MKKKVERITGSLAALLSSWDVVECVSLGEHSESDILDPYFALVLDVYHRGAIPPAEKRLAAFAIASGGDPGAFESSTVQSKDRFFIEGLPVRVEYKGVQRIDELLEWGIDPDVVWMLKNSGTYMFYRLQHSRILFNRSGWIDATRAKLSALPPTFWDSLRDAFQAKMEHYLSDLGAAALRDDGFFYLQSAAGFVRNAAAVLFMANRRFEPSHRLVDAQLRELERIPDDFFGRWDTLLRSNIDMSRGQKYEVAELIARSVIALR
jgi:hypothetical protein